MRTHWETGKNGKKTLSPPPPKLKRNKSKAPWAFPLAERKINPPPHPRPLKLAWKVHCPSGHGQSTLHTKCSLKKKTLPPNISPPPPPPPKLKRKKTKASWEHDWAFPLAGWNSSSQNSSSQFFAWANTPCKERPSYIGEKARILGNTYGFEIWCYWEHPWGTHWELGEQLGNMIRHTSATPKRKKKKKKSLPPPPKIQIKKLGPLGGCCLPIGCMQFLFPKVLVTIFNLG
jgi:hypothetical protein